MPQCPPEDAAASQLIPPTEPLPAHSTGASSGVGVSHEDTPHGGSINESEKQEFLWSVHNYTNEYIRFGDTKAAFAGTIASAFLGFLYARYEQLMNTFPTNWTVSLWLFAVGAIFLILSAFLALWTITPRLRSAHSKGYIYWGNIAAHGTFDLFRTSFYSHSPVTLNDHLLHHIYDLAEKVCTPKYRTIALCIWSLLLGVVISGIALITDYSHSSYKVFTSASPQITVPIFEGEIRNDESGKKFANFINENNGGVVYIDVWMDKEMAFAATDMKGFTVRAECDLGTGCGGSEYVLWTQEEADALYYYVPRTNTQHLKGYWAITTGTGFGQGIVSNVLKGVATEDAIKIK